MNGEKGERFDARSLVLYDDRQHWMVFGFWRLETG